MSNEKNSERFSCSYNYFKQKGLHVIKYLLWFIFLGINLSEITAQTTKPEWRFTSPLPISLTGHKSVTLHTGEVLVCGGITFSGAATQSSFVYKDGKWTQTANQLQFARAYHSLVAVRKQNGESIIFAIGGYSGSTGNYTSIPSVEVLQFTSTTQSWSWRMIGNLPASVGNCASAYNKKDYVVVSGGRIQNGGVLNSGVPTAISARINVNSLVIERIGDMASPRSEHATLMLNGAKGDSIVLSASGETASIPSTELLNNSTWDARANPPAFMQRFGANFTDDAEVARMVGGIDTSSTPTNRGQWYDTKSGWRPMPRMQTPRAKTSITQIAGIKDTTKNYIIVAGETTSGTTPKTELFSQPNSTNPNGTWMPFDDLNISASERTIAIDIDNLPLVSGGKSQNLIFTQCEQYQPFSANDIDFGQEEIGRESQRLIVKVTNNWFLPVQLRSIRIPGSAEFRLVNSRDSVVISPNNSLDIEVRFRPNTIGKRSAFLYFNAGSLVDSVIVSGEGIKSSIAVLTTIKDFGSRRILTDTTICFPALKNEGKDTTVIDSIQIDPLGNFVVISPLGRVRIPPDSTMNICMKFTPSSRQIFGAGAIIHISDKAFPISLTGRGIRAFINTTSQIGCDTIKLAPGDSLVYLLIISNNSDLDVKIDSTIIQTSLSGTFTAKNPSQFPLLMKPNDRTAVEIIFKPQQEAQERGTVLFVNNGDTICSANLCFVPRNRSININIPQSQQFAFCEGDSLQLPIILENPSNFDNLIIDSVYVQNMSGYSTGNVKTTLLPHQTIPANITIVPSQNGIQQATIVVLTNQGFSQSVVSLNVLPSMKFSIDTVTASVGDSIIFIVKRSDAISAVNSTELHIRYNGSVIIPRTIVNITGKNYINTSTSTLTNSYGKTTLSLFWNSHPATLDSVFGIMCEVLRGNDLQTSLSFESGLGNDVCVQQTSGKLIIGNICGGRNSLISTKNIVVMKLMPNPASEKITLNIIAPSNKSTLHIRNLFGEITAKYMINSFESIIDISMLATGLYYCELHTESAEIITQPITIIR